MSDEKPKIIIDDDWKKQAQAEKEQLDQKVKSEAKPAPAADGGDQAAPEVAAPRALPPADLATLVTSLAQQIMMSLGGMQDPRTGQRHVDLTAAKFHIDMLAVVETKTAGNLTDEEKKLLDETLYRMRMLYVEIAQQAAEL